MKDLRNPLTRTENFEHPSGNIMKELTEAELNSVAAGAGVARNSGGIACTLTGECNIGMVLCQDLVQVKMRNFSPF